MMKLYKFLPQAFLSALFLVPCTQMDAQVMYTIAGTGTASYNNDSIAATSAHINAPSGIVADAAGTIYFSDAANSRVRKISSSGTITTYAGTGVAGYGGDGSSARSAQISAPAGLALDENGNLYIADAGNNRIRMVDASGNISTVAGTGTAGYNGDGMPATSAQLNGPRSVAVDTAGNLYIADAGNNRVRKINTSGIISTAAGTGTPGYNGDGISAVTAQLNFPAALVILPASNALVISDYNNYRLRAIDPLTQTIVTFAGTGSLGAISPYILAANTTLNGISALATDGVNLYLAGSGNGFIYKINTAGTLIPVAGNGQAGFNGDGGAPLQTSLNAPAGIAVTPTGMIYIADRNNNRIRIATNTWYRDYDNDGFGKTGMIRMGLLPVAGYSGNGLDCNDSVANTSSWGYTGPVGFSKGAAAYVSIAVNKDGYPVVAYRDAANGSKATVMYYPGGSWTSYGVAGFTAAPVGYTDVAINAANIPYLAFSDGNNGNKVTVMKFDNNTWTDIGTPGFTSSSATNVCLAMDGTGAPHVAFRDVSNKANVMKYNGTTWVSVGASGFSSGTVGALQLAIDGAGTPYVAYVDSANGSKATVMKYNGSSWTIVGSAGFTGGSIAALDIAINNDGVPYIAVQTASAAGRVSVMKFDNGSWGMAGNTNFSSGINSSVTLAIDNSNNIYTAYIDGAAGDKINVMKSGAGTAWSSVGAAAFSGVVSAGGNSAITLDKQGIPYVAYPELGSSGKVSVMSISPQANIPSKPVLSGNTTVCSGSPTVLDVAAGNLGDGARWQWYTGGCGTNALSSNQSVAVTPTAKTTYYARAEGACLAAPGLCDSITVTVNPALVHEVTLSANPDTNLWASMPVVFTAHTMNSGANPVYEWYRNGTLVQGATSSTYNAGVVQNNDLVCVNVLSDEECAEPGLESACAFIHIDLGVERLNARGIRLFPNPNNGSFTLAGNTESNEPLQMEVLNTFGQLVYSGQLYPSGGSFSHPVRLDNDIANGLYVVRTRIGDKVNHISFNIQR